MPDELGSGADQRTVDQMMQELWDREHALEPEIPANRRFKSRTPPQVQQQLQEYYDSGAAQREQWKLDKLPRLAPGQEVPLPPLPRGLQQELNQSMQQPLPPLRSGSPRGPQVNVGPGGKPYAPAIKIGPNGEIIWPKE